MEQVAQTNEIMNYTGVFIKVETMAEKVAALCYLHNLTGYEIAPMILDGALNSIELNAFRFIGVRDKAGRNEIDAFHGHHPNDKVISFNERHKFKTLCLSNAVHLTLHVSAMVTQDKQVLFSFDAPCFVCSVPVETLKEFCSQI